MKIPFATQSYALPSLPVSAQRCVNYYAEQEPPDAKTQVAVFGAPGLTSFSSCGTGPVRQMHVMGDVLYVLSGDTLYSIDDVGAAVALGNSVSGDAVVAMSDNGTQLGIVNGEFGYIYSVAGGFQLITDADFHSANTITFFDGYFVLDWIGTNKFFISGLLDGTSYDALDFASAETHPDDVVATLNQQQNLLIFGTQSIETWYDAGTLDFPFQVYGGATIERGCVAPLTPIKEDSSVFFLGDDIVFYRLNGTQLARSSTHAIEAAWRSYATVSDAFTFSYTFEGHKFVVLTFPTGNATWVMDITTGLWHERESWDQNNARLGRWRGNCYVRAYGKDLIGDAFSGTIGEIDPLAYTEFDNVMQGMLTSPPLHGDRKRLFMSRFELDVESGVGLASGQGSDPQIMLDWSDDGGREYSGQQLWRSMGRIGAYKQRLRWLRLGQSRQRILRITVSDPVRRTIISAHADISSGM